MVIVDKVEQNRELVCWPVHRYTCRQRPHFGMCGRLRVPAGQFSMLRLDAAVCLFPVAIRPVAASVRGGRNGRNPVLRAGLLLNIEEVSRLGTLSASAGITPFELVRHIFRGSVSEIRMGRMGSDEGNS